MSWYEPGKGEIGESPSERGGTCNLQDNENVAVKINGKGGADTDESETGAELPVRPNFYMETSNPKHWLDCKSLPAIVFEIGCNKSTNERDGKTDSRNSAPPWRGAGNFWKPLAKHSDSETLIGTCCCGTTWLQTSGWWNVLMVLFQRYVRSHCRMTFLKPSQGTYF